MVLKLIDKWCAWGQVGGTQCAEGIISMTVMHQSIILAAPMLLPPPLPRTLVFLSWMANSCGKESWIDTYPVACPINVMQLVLKTPVGHSTYMSTVVCNCWPTSLISRLVLPKTASNISGFIAQLVRALHRYYEFTGSNPVEVLNIFFRLLTQLYKLQSQLQGSLFIWVVCLFGFFFSNSPFQGVKCWCRVRVLHMQASHALREKTSRLFIWLFAHTWLSKNMDCFAV